MAKPGAKRTPQTKTAAKTTRKSASAVGARSRAAEIRTKTGKKANATTFRKGQTGNPHGRPKLPEELKAAFRADAIDALKVLEQIMRSTKARPEARIKAAEVILNRGYGTPTQSVELTGKDGGPVESMTHEQALARLAELRAEDA